MKYITAAWYAAIWSSELQAEPVARKFLGEEVVLYRGEQGQAIALGGVCPHRFASLAKGKLHGDAIGCPYHGLRFGSDGRCVHNPNGPIPGVARVKSYPIIEHMGMAWIWMGQQPPDRALLPDVDLLAGDDFAWVHGTLAVHGNYQLVIDNLLDLTHVEFMHPFLAASQPDEPLRYEAKQEGDRVFALYDRDETPTPAMVRAVWNGAPEAVRLWSHIRWDAPSNLYLENGFAHVDPRLSSEALLIPTYHLLTPETATSTHYFWAAGRNMQKDNTAVSEQVRSGIEATFVYEDEPMIADIQQRLGETDLMELRPLLLSLDNAAVRARRIIAKALEQETPAA